MQTILPEKNKKCSFTFRFASYIFDDAIFNNACYKIFTT